MERSNFIEKAFVKHGNKYTYNKVPESFSCMDKVCITCPLHGDFIQQASSHTSSKGKGCKQCAGHRLIDTTSFILEAIKIHGDIYDYSELVYVKAHGKVKIICKEHGRFEMTAAAHIHQRQGCAKCNREAYHSSGCSSHSAAKALFILKASEIHNNRFDYRKVIYIRSSDKVIVICPHHGDFLITPNAHLRGVGCGICKVGGFNKNLKGVLYVLSNETMVKVGITNNSAANRCKTINQLSGKSFKVVWSGVDTGKSIQLIEKAILAELRQEYESPDVKFHGSTECFISQDINSILERVKYRFNNIQDV